MAGKCKRLQNILNQMVPTMPRIMLNIHENALWDVTGRDLQRRSQGINTAFGLSSPLIQITSRDAEGLHDRVRRRREGSSEEQST